MRTVLNRGCGLDVHKRSAPACLLKIGPRGEAACAVRQFETTTPAPRQLAQWLKAEGCQYVAMESTGVYWMPVFNILESACENIMLVNAQHVKNVPGRKTDVKDAQWIAELLAPGLPRASFIPPREIRELRGLTRYRKKLIQQRGDQSNRIQKLRKTCNIKLASYATDVLGVSGQQMLQALVEGVADAARMAGMARGRSRKREPRKKIPQLTEALDGVMSDTQRLLLGEQLEHVVVLDEKVARPGDKIEELTRPFAHLVEKLCEIPGVGQRVAEVILAEIGTNMRQFPTSRHLASWAGMCPGQNESGGKRRYAKTRKGSCWLKTALVEAGWAASTTKNTYLSAQYKNLARRRGKKRACVAVGHSILTIAYELILNRSARHEEMTSEAYRLTDRDRLKFDLIRRLKSLGVEVKVHDTHAA